MYKVLFLTLLLTASLTAFSQEVIAPNLITNSYMDVVVDGKPHGFTEFGGTLTLEAVHPYTKGFEGPYSAEAPAGAASSVNAATENSPYWFGRFNKGPRTIRGGMADGWHSYGGGKLLRVTGDNTGTSAAVFFPMERNVLTKKVRFRAWVKIVAGESVSFGGDAGYNHSVRGFTVTKTVADQSPDGWYRVDAVIEISRMTSLDGFAFSMGVNGSNIEVYLALPHLSVVDEDSWVPGITDNFIRHDIYMTGKNVGLGTDLSKNPNSYKLAVNGKIGAKEVQVENSSLTWPDYVFEESYPLTSLPDLEAYLKENKHLPGIPDEKTVEEEGIKLGEMNAKLLEKVEELTLYIIEQNKQIKALEKKNEAQDQLLQELINKK